MILAPMAFLALLFWDVIRPRLRELAIALGLFLIAASPILMMTLKQGGIFKRIGWSGSNSGSLTLSGFVATLSEEFLHFKGMLGGIDGVQVGNIGREVRNLWMNDAFGISIIVLAVFFIVAGDRKEFIRRNAAPLVITLFGLLVTGFIITGRATYQLIVLWPFATLVVGAGLAHIPQRFRLVAIALASALVISQAAVTVKAHQRLSQSGGRIFTSSQIYPLAHYFEQRSELRPIAMEWGLLNQIYFLTGGRVLPQAIHGWWPRGGTPPDEFNAAVSKQLEHPNNVYIFLGPQQGFERYPHFERLANGSNRTVRLEKVFYERDGSIAYRLYVVSSPRY
jgi:hypothetical protein